MSHTLHSLARTTPKTRAEIRALRESGVSQRELMRRYSISKATDRQMAEARGCRRPFASGTHAAHPPLRRAGVNRCRTAPPVGVAPG
jgi:hypothetical protein